MPRAQRLDLAGVAQHAIQHGKDRQARFHRKIDLQDVREAALKPDCRMHTTR